MKKISAAFHDPDPDIELPSPGAPGKGYIGLSVIACKVRLGLASIFPREAQCDVYTLLPMCSEKKMKQSVTVNARKKSAYNRDRI